MIAAKIKLVRRNGDDMVMAEHSFTLAHGSFEDITQICAKEIYALKHQKIAAYQRNSIGLVLIELREVYVDRIK